MAADQIADGAPLVGKALVGGAGLGALDAVQVARGVVIEVVRADGAVAADDHSSIGIHTVLVEAGPGGVAGTASACVLVDAPVHAVHVHAAGELPEIAVA